MGDAVKKIDLYLGGPVGLWALRQVSPRHVASVTTLDAEIGREAGALGVEVRDANASAEAGARGEVGLSVHYPRVLKPRLIEQYAKIYNLHPGYLPWGRGFYPVFWALWEQTPAGATLHEITPGIDEGPVVAQARVEYYPHDTGGSLHDRVREAEEQLFLSYWPRILEGERLPAVPQAAGEGSYHTKREFFAIKEQAPVGSLSGAEVLRLIRCLTFPGFSGMEVSAGGKKFHLRFEPLARDGDD